MVGQCVCVSSQKTARSTLIATPRTNMQIPFVLPILSSPRDACSLLAGYIDRDNYSSRELKTHRETTKRDTKLQNQRKKTVPVRPIPISKKVIKYRYFLSMGTDTILASFSLSPRYTAFI